MSPELKAALSILGRQTNAERAMVRARHNLVQVSVFFSSNTGRRTVKDVRMTWTEILGSVGGSLGLFTGFSLLSLCELLYFGGKVFCALAVRRRGPKKNVTKTV